MIEKQKPHVIIFRHAAIGDVMVTLPALEDIRAKHDVEQFANLNTSSTAKHDVTPSEQQILVSDFYLVGTATWAKMLSPQKYHWIKKIFVSDKKGHITGLYSNEKTQWSFNEEKLHLTQLLSKQTLFYNLRTDSLRLSFYSFMKRTRQCYATTPYWAQFLVTHCDPWIGFESPVHERDRMLKIVHAKKRQWWPIWSEKKLRAYETQLPFARLSRSLPLPIELDLEKLKAQTHHSHLIENIKKPIQFEQNKKIKILINPTASERYKAWASDRFYELALKLEKHFESKIHISILGAPNETQWLNEVAQNHFQIIQPTSLENLFEVIATHDYLIGNTSSSQFIANSTLTPVFTIIGRAQARRWGPLGKYDSWIEANILDSHINASEENAYASLTIDEVYKKIELHLTELYF